MTLQIRARLPQPLRAALRTAYRAATAPSDLVAVRELARAPNPDAARIADALRAVKKPLPGGEQARIDAIEQARTRMERRADPLVDGSLNVPPGYDVGVTVSQACSASKPLFAALLLYHLAKRFRPGTALELGTNVGISSAYIAAGLQGRERLTTLEVSPYRLRLAREVHARLGLANIGYRQGLFVETLGPALQEIGSPDLVFIDGHHQYEPTLAYFEAIWPHARPGALFIFDDIRWSQGMRRAWAKLREDERFALVVDVGVLGLCVGRAPGVSGRYQSRRMYSIVR